jgi:peptidoglycan/xylan/chitin deacetylase (PgdA/CDA1 family)
MSDVVVLCYHAVSDSWPDALAVTPDDLRAQLQSLVDKGYRGATFSDAMTAPPSRRTLAVTFDDAFSSVAELARPILEELGLPGTVFVVSEFGDGSRLLRWPGIEQWHDGPHEAELRCMDWDQLRELAGAGWEIGAHTCSHPHLTQIDDAAVARELLHSRLACEAAMRRPCRSVAYPYGDVDARVVAHAREAGYEVAAGLPDHPAPRDPMDWPRIGIYRRDSLRRFQVKCAPATRRLRYALRRVEALAGR